MNEDQELSEEFSKKLFAPNESTPMFSDGWATLSIDMTMLSEEQRQKVYQVENLLIEIGVGFDKGSGFGYRDWELDWSLSGALVKAKSLYCMNCSTGENRTSVPKPVWAIWKASSGSVLSYPYCSEVCRSADAKKGSGWELITYA